MNLSFYYKVFQPFFLDEKPRKRSLTKPDQSRIVAKKSKLKEEGDILEAKPVDDDLNVSSMVLKSFIPLKHTKI